MRILLTPTWESMLLYLSGNSQLLAPSYVFVNSVIGWPNQSSVLDSFNIFQSSLNVIKNFGLPMDYLHMMFNIFYILKKENMDLALSSVAIPPQFYHHVFQYRLNKIDIEALLINQGLLKKNTSQASFVPENLLNQPGDNSSKLPSKEFFHQIQTPNKLSNVKGVDEELLSIANVLVSFTEKKPKAPKYIANSPNVTRLFRPSRSINNPYYKLLRQKIANMLDENNNCKEIEFNYTYITRFIRNEIQNHGVVLADLGTQDKTKKTYKITITDAFKANKLCTNLRQNPDNEPLVLPKNPTTSM